MANSHLRQFPRIVPPAQHLANPGEREAQADRVMLRAARLRECGTVARADTVPRLTGASPAQIKHA